MNRKEFLEKLEGLLSGLPESEREEALMYYNDYFDDAGPENEAAVIEKLGSPGQVAESILYGMSVDGRDGVFTEQGYESKGSSRDRHVPGVLFMPPVTKQKDGKHRQAEGQRVMGAAMPRQVRPVQENDGRRRFKDLSTGARIGWIALFCQLSFLLAFPLSVHWAQSFSV